MVLSSFFPPNFHQLINDVDISGSGAIQRLLTSFRTCTFSFDSKGQL